MKKIWFLMLFALFFSACSQQTIEIPSIDAQHFGTTKTEVLNDFSQLDRNIITRPLNYKECLAKNGSGAIHKSLYNENIYRCQDSAFTGEWEYRKERDNYETLEYKLERNLYNLDLDKNSLLTTIFESVKLPIAEQNSLIEMFALTGAQLHYQQPNIKNFNPELVNSSFWNSNPSIKLTWPLAKQFKAKWIKNWFHLEKTSKRKDEPHLKIEFDDGKEFEVWDLRRPDEEVKYEGMFPYTGSITKDLNYHLKSKLSSNKSFIVFVDGGGERDPETDERIPKREIYFTGEIKGMNYQHFGFEPTLCYNSFCFDPQLPIQNYKNRYYQKTEIPEKETVAELLYNSELQIFLKNDTDFGESGLSREIINTDYALNGKESSFCWPKNIKQTISKGKENLTFPKHLTFFWERYDLQNLDLNTSYGMLTRNEHGYIEHLDEIFESAEEAEKYITSLITEKLLIYNTYLFRFASHPNIIVAYSNILRKENPQAIIYSTKPIKTDVNWTIYGLEDTKQLYCELGFWEFAGINCKKMVRMQERTFGSILFLDEEKEKKADYEVEGRDSGDIILNEKILPLFRIHKSKVPNYYYLFPAQWVEFAEGGYGCKPVIYTYDQLERENQVQITLPPQSKFTKLIPAFTSGTTWQFSTDRNSNISLKNQAFPYLYYSTLRKDYKNNNYGRTVKGKDIPLFLENKLTAMNFNQKEKADFLEYWLPEFDENFVYTVSFKFNEQFDPYAQLQWQHQPEKIFRVFMEAHQYPSSHSVSFNPYFPNAGNREFLRRFERGSSFDVLEWGGNLEKLKYYKKQSTPR